MINEVIHCSRGYSSDKYHDLIDIFRLSKAKSLPSSQPYDHPIDLVPGKMLPPGKVYPLSNEQDLWLVMNHDNGCIDGYKSSGLKSINGYSDKEKRPDNNRVAYLRV